MAPIKAWLVINACERDCDKGLDNNNNKYSCLLCQCKGKGKGHPCTGTEALGHMAPKGCRGIALLFHDQRH
jgi:hypothetical protein